MFRHLGLSVLVLLLLLDQAAAQQSPSPDWGPLQPYQSRLQSFSEEVVRYSDLTLFQDQKTLLDALEKLGRMDAELREIVARVEQEPESAARTQALTTLGQFRLNALTAMALLLEKQGKHGLAIERLESFAPFAKEHGGPFTRATLDKTLADIYQQINRPRQAAELYQSALELYSGEPAQFAYFIHHLRVSYFQTLESLGRTQEALAQLDQALLEVDQFESPVRDKLHYSILFNRGYLHLRLGQPALAKQDLEATTALPHLKDLPLLLYRSLLSLALVAGREGEREARADYLERAHQILQQVGEEKVSPDDLSLYHQMMASTARSENRFSDALKHIAKVDQIHEVSGAGGPSPVLDLKFELYQRSGRLEELLPQLREYLDSVADPTLMDLQYELIYWRIVAERGEPDQALEALDKLAADLGERQANALLIETYFTIAKIYQGFDLTSAATDWYRKGLVLAQQSQNAEKIREAKSGIFWSQMSETRYLEGEKNLAQEFEELLVLSAESGQSLELATLLIGYVRQLTRDGDYERALQLLGWVTPEQRAAYTEVEIAVTLLESQVARELEERTRGPELLKKLRALAAKPSNKDFNGVLLREIIRWQVMLEQDFWSDTLPRYLKARQNLQGMDRLNELLFRASLARATGAYEVEGQLLDGAEELLKSIRGLSELESFTGAGATLADELFSMQVTRHLRDSRVEEAFQAAERGRGQTLAALFERRVADSLSSASEAEKARVDDLYRRRDELESAMLSQDLAGTQTLGALKQVVAEIDDILSRLGPRRSELLNSQEVSLEAVQRALKPGQILLRYFVGPGHEGSYLFVVSKDQAPQVHRLPTTQELMSMVTAYRLAIERLDGTEQRRLKKKLSEILLGPVKQLDYLTERIIVPDGPLHLLPYSSLESKRGVPLYQGQLSILPSARMLLNLAGQEEKENATITVWADPRFSDRGSGETNRGVADRLPQPLPGTREEAETIESLFGKQRVALVTGSEASRENLLQKSERGELLRHGIVHFATHGFTTPSDPRMSGLILSLFDAEGRPVNGYLRLIDIYRLRLDSDLVVLSACQTGLGTIRAGEGLLGLYQGFLIAGSRRILNTLWSVDDAATKEFMHQFYAARLQGASSKKALSQAQAALATSTRWSDPYYWAGFQLISP